MCDSGVHERPPIHKVVLRFTNFQIPVFGMVSNGAVIMAITC